ncbi:MAG: hypothetical protein FD137_1823 [Spirochaetes bacterium]|nr:MAG: hypothetical protein FD137_1823 [Spirochaetota bacterium]
MDTRNQEISALIQQGGSLSIEFKSDLKCLSDRELVAAVVSMANTEGGEILLGVEDDGTVTGRGRSYTLSAKMYQKAGKKVEYIRQAGFALIQQEQMVLSYIEKHGSIKRGEVMDLCRLDRNQAYRLLSRMKKTGQISQKGDHKGAVYERA